MDDPFRLAQADADYVLRWLLEVHSAGLVVGTIPDNIIGLARRATTTWEAKRMSEVVGEDFDACVGSK